MALRINKKNNNVYFKLLIFIALASLIYYSCQKDYNKPDNAASGYFGIRSEVSISQIILDSFPVTDTAGLNWDYPATDSTRFPDIFYNIFIDPDSTNMGFYQATHFENVDPDSLPLTYTLTTPYTLPGFGTIMTLKIFDFEIDSAAVVDTTEMTSFTFSVSPGDTITNPDPYPQTISVGNSAFKLRLGLVWK